MLLSELETLRARSSQLEREHTLTKNQVSLDQEKLAILQARLEERECNLKEKYVVNWGFWQQICLFSLSFNLAYNISVIGRICVKNEKRKKTSKMKNIKNFTCQRGRFQEQIRRTH